MKNKALLALIAVSAFAAGCDRIPAGAEGRSDRSNKIYQEAMADYSAGRLDAAQKGFEKVIRADPSNASARFQLACMLQDRKGDYLAAYCGYQEYLLREPKSDKAALARERAALCRTEAAKAIARELGFSGEDSRAHAELEESLAAAKRKLAKLEKDGAESAAKLARLEAENARLRRMVASVGDDMQDGAQPKQRIAAASADILDDDDGRGDAGMEIPDEVAALAMDDEAPPDMGGASLEEARALVVDDSTSDLLAGEAPPNAVKLTETASRRRHKGDFGPADVSRPATYVVQENDTLYKIAVRFYGKASAWRKIRDANKATVSMDGRIQKGQKLVLP